MIRVVYILIFLLYGLTLFSQTAKVTVFDKLTGKPIEFVHLFVKNPVNNANELVVTNIYGQAQISLESKHEISISFVGYQTINDTISPNETKVYYLSKGAFKIQDIVVSGSLFPEEQKKSMIYVNRLDLQYIENSAAVNLSELLENQLSLRLWQDAALGSSITINGIGGQNIKILHDGIPLIGRLNGNIDLSQIDLSNVKSVEIVEGPMSDIFGSNALGGIINLITKNPSNNSYNLGLDSYYESVGVYDFNGYGGFKKKKVGTYFNLGRYFFDGYSEIDTSRHQEWRLKERYNASIKLNGSLSKLNWSVTSNYFNEMLKDKGTPRAPYFESAFDTYFYTSRNLNSFHVFGPISNKSRIDIVGSYSFYKRIKNTYFRDLVSLTDVLTSNDFDQDTAFFNATMFRSFINVNQSKNVQYKVGIDANYEIGNGNKLIDKQDIFDIALFASGTCSFNRFSAKAGVRFPYNSLFDSPLIPSLNIKYDFNEMFQLRTSFSNGFRAPSLKEQFLEFVDVNHNIHGNQNLQAEKSNHLLFSLHYSKEKETKYLKVFTKGYYNKISNIITLIEEKPGYYTYTNLDSYISYGSSIDFHYSIHPHYSINTGLSLLCVNDEYENVVIPSANILFDYWRASKKFNFTITYKYNGKYTQYVYNEVGDIDKQILPGYSFMDITLHQKLWKNKLTVGTGVKNILNITSMDASFTSSPHSNSNSIPISWGRTFFLTLKLNFDKNV